MGDRPVLFLDVDGALSPLNVESPWPDAVWMPTPVRDLLVSRLLGDALHRLPVQIVFATSWGSAANAMVSPLFGWPELVTLCPATAAARKTAWKGKAVRDFVQSNPRPFLWVDDEANRDQDMGWATQLGVPHKLIVTDGLRGITQSEIDEIISFVSAVSHTSLVRQPSLDSAVHS